MINGLVSVIIPTYNHGEFLKRALKSVCAQSWKNWEIIVVDNCSTDNTDEIMNGWVGNNIKYLKVNNNGVIAVSRNVGIRAACGEWIAFLDSDDWWESNKLEKTINLSAGTDVLYHDLKIYDQKSKKILRHNRVRSRQIARPHYFELLKLGNVIPNSSVVVRRSCLDSIEYLDEDPKLVGCEDFDLWLRLAKKGYDFRRIKGSYGFYQINGGNVSNPMRMLFYLRVLARKYFDDGSMLPFWIWHARLVLYIETGQYRRGFVCLRNAFKSNLDAYEIVKVGFSALRLEFFVINKLLRIV